MGNRTSRYTPMERVAANRCYLATCERDLTTRGESFDLVWRTRSGSSTIRFCSANCGHRWLEKHPEERHIEEVEVDE